MSFPNNVTTATASATNNLTVADMMAAIGKFKAIPEPSALLCGEDVLEKIKSQATVVPEIPKLSSMRIVVVPGMVGWKIVPESVVQKIEQLRAQLFSSVIFDLEI